MTHGCGCVCSTRKRVAAEILATEQTYVEGLDNVVGLYINPLLEVRL